MKIIYRISPEGAGYKKDKPDYVNNENCLKNFIKIFGKEDVLVLFDEDYCIKNYDNKEHFVQQSILDFDNLIMWCDAELIDYKFIQAGSSAKSFNKALDIALTYSDGEIVYFVENDYIHKLDSDVVLKNVFESNFCQNLFVSLYQHPDKFLHSSLGGNPFVNSDNSYSTLLYATSYCYWNVVDSTTMTFATKVETLKKFEHILREFTSGTYPQDANMFWKLNQNGCMLATPLPTFATHGETKWLAKFENWKQIIEIKI
jgi:hypothetical protein